MSPLLLPCAFLSGVVLAGMSVSLVALVRARALLREAGRGDSAGLKQWETELQAMSQDVDALGVRLDDILRQPPATEVVPASSFRPGLNLSARSQALRMFHQGQAPARIAVALEVPLQEVDLLLKVQRIVTGSL